LTAAKAFLIPGDVPPSESTLKRQLLFFDLVLLPDLTDRAIINDHEIRETFPDGFTLEWGAIGPYPRSVSHDDQYRFLRAQVALPVSRGKLQFVPIVAASPEEASKAWVSAAAALKKDSLVRAALPDHHANVEPATVLNSNIGGNMVVPSRAGYDSEYVWLTKVDAQPVVEVHELWRRVAMGRLGRAMKAIQRANRIGAVPLAADATNSGICLALGAEAYAEIPTPAQLASTAVALDAVDPVALDAALGAMSWSEVFRVRKEVLPAVVKLRGQLIDSVKVANRPQNASIDSYRLAIKEMRDRYQRAESDVSAAWRKVGIKTIEGSVGMVPAGLAAIATSPHWVAGLASIAGGLILKAAQGSIAEIDAIRRGKKMLRASPLFAFDTVLDRRKAELLKANVVK
jgi:hypothetical protein